MTRSTQRPVGSIGIHIEDFAIVIDVGWEEVVTNLKCDGVSVAVDHPTGYRWSDPHIRIGATHNTTTPPSRFGYGLRTAATKKQG